MGKPVRNCLPALFGGTAIPLDDTGYRGALRDNLREVGAEYLESVKVMALADVLEVGFSLVALDGVTAAPLEELRAQ